VERNAQHVARVNGIAAEYLLVHTGHPGRRIQQSLPLDIFPDQSQNFPDMRFDLIAIRMDVLVDIFLDTRQRQPLHSVSLHTNARVASSITAASAVSGSSLGPSSSAVPSAAAACSYCSPSAWP